MAESDQKERLSEPNRILIDLGKQPPLVDPSSMISIPELVASFQGIKAEKEELIHQKRALQVTERELRTKVIQEIDKRWKAIEYLKSEIMILQNKCNEIVPQMLSEQTTEKSIADKTSIENIRQKQTLLVSFVVATGLILYALGIATNFFASPIFAPFFILSYNTAHELAYGVAAAGAALIAVILTLNFRKKAQHQRSGPRMYRLSTIHRKD